VTGRNAKPAQGQVRIGKLDTLGQWGDQRSQASRGYDPGFLVTWPFLVNTSDHAIHRVGGAEQHSRLNAFFGTPADDPGGSSKLRRRKLGRTPSELIG
jgi:hypothetical protein